MIMSTVIAAATLLEDYEKAKEMAEEVEEIKDNIAGEMCINCKNPGGFHLDTVKIEEDDAKRILQFIEDYYSGKTAEALKKIGRLS